MIPARIDAINVMCIVKRHKLKNVKLVKDVVEQIMRQILVVTVAMLAQIVRVLMLAHLVILHKVARSAIVLQ